MIVVTGCKRSGTSMWMQVLRAAGFAPIGMAYPADWGTTALREANPDGFFEGAFRNGVHAGTNPIPGTDHYLSPAASRRMAVKIFPAGFRLTHRAFIDSVVVTMRSWRAYGRSRTRLAALDHAAMEERFSAVGAATDSVPRPTYVMPPLYEWWLENFSLRRDLEMRRLDHRWVSFEAARADPRAQMSPVLGWLGGDADAWSVVREHGAAVAESRPLLDPRDEELEARGSALTAMADAWHRSVSVGEPGPSIGELKSVHHAFREEIATASQRHRAAREAWRAALAESAPSTAASR